MRTKFARAFKRNRHSIALKDVVASPELASASNAVRRILKKKEYAELLRKETMSCLLATD
jgi:hypothetical protein